MRRIVPAVGILLASLLAVPPSPGRPDDKAAPKDAPKELPKEAPKPDKSSARGFVQFRTQEIDRSLKVGYAVITADVNGDGKPDIVVVDTDRVVWYENPGAAAGEWKRRTIIEKQTKADNVCIAAADIDGDGKVDFVIGAGWGRFDTKVPGTLQWVRRGKSLDEPGGLPPLPRGEPTAPPLPFLGPGGAGQPQPGGA